MFSEGPIYLKGDKLMLHMATLKTFGSSTVKLLTDPKGRFVEEIG